MSYVYRLFFHVKITIPYTKVPARWRFWKSEEAWEFTCVQVEYVTLTEIEARAAAGSPRIAQALALERFSRSTAEGQLYSDLHLIGPYETGFYLKVVKPTSTSSFSVHKRIPAPDLAPELGVIDIPYTTTRKRYTSC